MLQIQAAELRILKVLIRGLNRALRNRNCDRTPIGDAQIVGLFPTRCSKS